MAGYGLVNLIREFCDEFHVIIPFKAYSCATLISLGANSISMTRMGQLSPIDPSLEHPLGPVVQLPGQPPRIMPVSVEDVNAYIDLATKEVKLKEESSMAKVFEILSTKVHPMVLGAVQRSREQIGFLARSLLKMHMMNSRRIEKIVSVMTSESFSHTYLISRKEARQVLGLNIIDAEPEVMRLFEEYRKILLLEQPFNPETFLGTEPKKVGQFDRALIESRELTHVFRTIKSIERASITQPGIPIPVSGYQEIINQEEWIKCLDI